MIQRVRKGGASPEIWLISLAIFFVAAFAAREVRANVYATQVRLNGATTNLILLAGNTINISYILNEPASAGVTIRVSMGATVVRNINVPAGNAGALRGTNTVVWDGKDNSGQNLAIGSYSVSVAAAATGYGDWTQTSMDSMAGNYVYAPRGIAVNKNLSSPFYGRVFVSNSAQGPGVNTGDNVGILKLNADGSPADEGEFSNGGWAWAGDEFSPWKIEVGTDDRVYVNDWTAQGIIVSFDQTISTNLLQVLRPDNWANGGMVNLSGPFISGSGTNMRVWMADASSGSSLGILSYKLTNSIIAAGNVGTSIVAAGAGTDIDQYPWDVALDASNRIYTIQLRPTTANPSYGLFRFAAYAGKPLSNADWKIGTNDDSLEGAYGVAVDPTAQYVAVACIGDGLGLGTNNINGSTRVFASSNGASVVTLGPARYHAFTDVAWDNAGNLYATDTYGTPSNGVWRVYSPPGSNQMTTVALATVQVLSSGTQPVLSAPRYSNGQFHFTLTGEPNVVYIIQGSSDLTTWTSLATNNSVFATRSISVAAPQSMQYFRAIVVGFQPAPPVLHATGYAAGQFNFSLTGAAYISYVIQQSSNLTSWLPIQTNSSSEAVRQISVPATAKQGFFRAVLTQ